MLKWMIMRQRSVSRNLSIHFFDAFSSISHPLRDVENYKFVEEITILTVADIYERKVRVCCGRQCMVYSHCSSQQGKKQEIKLRFIEPAHCVAVVAVSEGVNVKCYEEKTRKKGL